jgi:hypothetical protein
MLSSSNSVNFTSTERTHKIRSRLQSWLSARLSSEALAWMNATMAGEFLEQAFFTAFSSLPRRVGEQYLGLTAAELAQADALCPGWYPKAWSVEQAARSLL